MRNPKEHRYAVEVRWTGNLGNGTSDYRAYSRGHEILVAGKPPIAGSSDPAFRGDPDCHSPEELLVSALSACHMLWYLHLCADAGIVVVAYLDRASGVMAESPDHGGRFLEVELKPQVTISRGADRKRAVELHDRAHRLCYVANSVNFPVRCTPTTLVEESGS